MINNLSKKISKADDDAKMLIIEALEDNFTGGFDLDSIYEINGKYVVIEFLKCITVKPFKSHPNRYWFKNSKKFISLWKITKKLDGTLFLVNYEDSREQFSIIKVLKIDKSGVAKEERRDVDFETFKNWFQKLNSESLNS